MPLVETRNLSVHFPVRGGFFGGVKAKVQALNSVNIEIEAGETLGIVGESGCGKSTLARALLRIVPASEGRISFDGVDVGSASAKELRSLRQDMQIVFQDPFSSLNPRMHVQSILEEPLRIHGVGPEERKERVAQVIDQVGLPGSAMRRYPHEFSGGQRQRIGIARAIILRPKLVVADEPVSALDVSIQSQILNLLCELKAELGLTYVFIAHDLAVVQHISDRVAVMYLGRVVELSSVDELYDNPRHPYTRALLDAVPKTDFVDRQRELLLGDVPNPIDPPSGCSFHPRCPLATEECRSVRPKLESNGSKSSHRVACHHA